MVSFAPAQVVNVEALGTNSDAVCWMGLSAQQQQMNEVKRAGLNWGESEDVVRIFPGAVVAAAALKAFVLSLIHI